MAMLDRLRLRPSSYGWAWSFGVMIFTLGVFTQFWGALAGWNETLYKLWYWSGGIAVAAWWGVGSVYLLAYRRWWGHAFMGFVALISILGALILVTTPVDFTEFEYPIADSSIHAQGIPAAARALAAVPNIVGTIAIVGVAIWSALSFHLHKSRPLRATSSVLVAVGTIVIAVGGSFSRFDITAPLYITQLSGFALVFIGFAVNIKMFSRLRIHFTTRDSLRA